MQKAGQFQTGFFYIRYRHCHPLSAMFAFIRVSDSQADETAATACSVEN